MNPLRTLGAWLTGHLIEDGRTDHPAREGRVPPQAPTVDPLTETFASLPSHDERRICGTAKDIAVGVSWYCHRVNGHDGDHESYWASGKTAHRWPETESTALFDAVQHQHAARRMAAAAMTGGISRDLAAVAEIGAAANTMRDAGDAAWEYALAGLLDDAEGGEQR